MPLAPGTRLGPYEIVAAIGAGGMGEVYRARDTKLNRDVALKILPASFIESPDRLARFEQEAQLLASLNHPNIGTIYGLEESRGIRALVLELIDGPTLAETIGDRPMDTARILAIGEQMADALVAAHAKGITHRDIKPANVMLTARGDVKVLDFGLAKVSTLAAQADAAATNVTQPGTTPGVAMGTVAYRSPEQASGQTIDHRDACAPASRAAVEEVRRHNLPLMERSAASLPPSFAWVREHYFDGVKDALGDAVFQSALSDGRAMSMRQAIQHALEACKAS